MTSTQHGQAIIAVMVVMLILFALAGAVAIGASTLLTSRGESIATNADFQVRSAVNDAVSQIMAATRRCGAPPPLPSPSPTAAPTPTPSPLNLSLPPNTPPAVSTQALCARQDAVDPTTMQRVQPPSNCATVPLGRIDGRTAVLFDARVADFGWAFLDTNSALVACTSGTLPTPSPSNLPCRRAFGPGAVVQVALTCDFAPGDSVYLHLNAPGAGPKNIFTASQDPQAPSSDVGFLYLVAAGTGVSSPDYEELVLYISNNGTTHHLLYEAPLP